MKRKPNALINESSPYLRQHAYNPVNWHAWNQQTLAKARKENKLMIVSIGYSTCHWCHVMEHDSFENEEVAALMNEHFIPVKVDREERPDLDSVYMQSVQLMTGRGGWPLNCITLPDGKPLFGGTFFPRQQWMEILKQVSNLWQYEPERCRMYADQLIAGLKKTELIKRPENPWQPRQIIETMIRQMLPSFDRVHGGFSRTPKFPMPAILSFLLRYAFHTGHQQVLDHVMLTLDKMACGGIYDHLGGGFARYSTDAEWKVPHFEKMLYDNAQLVSLYASAYAYTGRDLYRQITEETIRFVTTELLSPEGGFYSALDADSEGQEGKFYIWTLEELKEVLGEDYSLFSEAFYLDEKGHWEDGNYVLVKRGNAPDLKKQHEGPQYEINQRLHAVRQKLLERRNRRIRPARDDKFILCWNALMMTACCDAYRFLGNPDYLKLAINNFLFIEHHLVSKNSTLLHSTHPEIIAGDKKNHSPVAFADDYAAYALACLKLFTITSEELYLKRSLELCRQADELFTDVDTGLLFYTSIHSESLIVRRTETEDNVIPSSNSMYAHLLFNLGHLTGQAEWERRAIQMCRWVESYMVAYPSGFAQWGSLVLNKAFPFFELVITGSQATDELSALMRLYQPDVLLCATEKYSDIEIFRNRVQPDKLKFYLCMDHQCFQPVEDRKEVIQYLESARRNPDAFITTPQIEQ
jgi:uncharacterized protein YyaL (SSP411 family)